MTMKISATKNGDSHIDKSSSGLFLGIVFVLLLIGILALSLWVSELSKDSNSINSKVESRLSILEEQLQLADSTSTEFLSDINTQLQFLDKEIRKLWDLSNKRNKVNIQNLSNETEEIQELLNTIKIDIKEISEENILELAIDAGADECISHSDFHEIHCPVSEIYNVKKNLEKTIANFISTEIEWIPLNSVNIQSEKKDVVTEFFDILEDDDDVQNIFSNVNLEVN